MDITKDPIPGLLRRIAVPASLGFFFNTMFNVVDTYYAGQLSTDSLAALSLSFPIFFILMSLGIGIQSGAGALIANALGAKDTPRAVGYQAQALTLAMLTTAVVAIPLYFSLPPIFRFFGAEGDLLAAGLRYMRVIVAGSIFIIGASTLNAGLQARGDTSTYRNLLIVMSLLNIIFDPILMFGVQIGGVQLVPMLREAGTALATISLYALGVPYLLARGRRAGTFSGLRARDFIPRAELMRPLIGQSLPAAMNFMIMTLGAFVINYFISRYGRDAVAAYGTALRVEQIALLPLLGLNVALATLVGQNNGAGRIDRVREAFNTTMKTAVIMAVFILTPVIAAAPWLLRVFTSNENVVAIGRHYLYVQAITFFSYIAMNLCNSVLQGLKRPGMIVWVALYRQLGAPLLVFPFLAYRLGMEVGGVFWGLVVVNWSAAAFTLFYAAGVLRTAEAAAAQTGVEPATATP